MSCDHSDTAGRVLTKHNANEADNETLWAADKVNELGQRQLRHTTNNVSNKTSDAGQTVLQEGAGDPWGPGEARLLLQRVDEGDKRDPVAFRLALRSNAAVQISAHVGCCENTYKV